jgi:hypothetical protein
MFTGKLELSDEFNQATTAEVEKLTRDTAEQTGRHIDAYIEFEHIIKALSGQTFKINA